MANLANFQLSSSENEESGNLAVHKFGGSSLSSISRVRNVVDVIKQHSDDEDIIVVSANGDITDKLVEFSLGNKRGLEYVEEYYRELVTGLIHSPSELLAEFEQNVNRLRNAVLSEEEILAYGEVWSARLLNELLNQENVGSLFTDARRLFKTDSIESYQHFDRKFFEDGLSAQRYGNYKKRLVVTGYIASNQNQQTITLGRNGSDYSASLLAHFVGAKSVTLWTDVAGIYSADPRLVSKASPIAQLTYDEARELSAIGTNVLHQKTIGPLRDLKIPLLVKASLQPDEAGTRVSSNSVKNAIVRSVALKTGLVEVVVEGLVESVKGEILHQLFESHVVTITDQNKDSESSCTLFIADSGLPVLLELLVRYKLAYTVRYEECSVVSVVGENLGRNSLVIQNLSSKISRLYDYRLINDSAANAVKLVTREKDAARFLKEIFYICFNTDLLHQEIDTKSQFELLDIKEAYA